MCQILTCRLTKNFLTRQKLKVKQISVRQKIKLWAKVGRNALANPDLPVDFIAKILIAKNQETEPFEFEE